MSCEACGKPMALECDSEHMSCEACGTTEHGYCAVTEGKGKCWYYQEEGGYWLCESCASKAFDRMMNPNDAPGGAKAKEA